MVEHQVDDYAGDRNIKPQRQRPASDPPVSDEIATRRSVNGNYYEGNNDNG